MHRVLALILAASLVSFSLASPLASRGSLVRVPFAKRINETHIKDVLRRDQARAATLKSRTKVTGARGGQSIRANAISIPATNQAVDYVASVQVGTQSAPFDLIIDTGSSNTWVGAGQKLASSSAETTGNEVAVEYGSGFVIGEEVTDALSLGSGLAITGQSLGSALLSEGFDDVDGILGIGPVDLTEGTLIPDETATIPTVTDNLFSQGLIPAHEVAVSFEPTTEDSITNGELTFGGTDSSKFTGSITFFPITSTSPASEFWGIDQSITFGTADTEILSSTAGIVDTGTTLILIATDAFSAYEAATGATLDETTGLLKLSPAQFADLESLNFNIGSTTFELTPNAQAWPRALNTAIGGTADNVYLVVNSIGTASGEGLDFINGQTFLERFYSVFDTANQRVGLATTPFTTATTN